MHKLSICINIKDRSLVTTEHGNLYLFPECIKSLNACIDYIPLETELVIADWMSTDWPIRTWINTELPDKDIYLLSVHGKYFNHGKGRNIAAEYASGDVLFFLDADMIVVPELFTEGVKALSRGEIFCPIAQYYTTPDRSKSDWCKRPGCMMIKREIFYKVGKWPEYKQWGFEDFAFIEALQKDYKITFQKIPGYIHQWHPQEKEWKNRYTDNTPAASNEHHEIRTSWQNRIDNEEQQIINGLRVVSNQAIDKGKKVDNIGDDIPRIGAIRGSKH